MTTARALLMRLLTRGKIHPGVAIEGGEAKRSAEPPVDERLDAARQRLKETIPPPEGASPEEGSSSVLGDPPPEA